MVFFVPVKRAATAGVLGRAWAEAVLSAAPLGALDTRASCG